MHDLVIRGGTVVDGTGTAPTTADIAVDDGKISEVGDLGTAPAPGGPSTPTGSPSSPAWSTSTPTTTGR